MREILFRGKAIIDEDILNIYGLKYFNVVKSGEFIYGSIITNNSRPFIVGSVVEATDEYISLEQWVPVDPKTVGQYTGMEDEKLNRIFEGDVLDSEEFSNTVVSYNEHDACFIGGDTPFSEIDPDDDEIWKVIGNIHENQELLEANK
jgi:hypothetical protein